MLEIKFFGKPQLVFNGNDVAATMGSKANALLCLLFLRKDNCAPREKIAAYLWPDSTADASKYNLRYNLWLIKKSTDTDEDGNSLIKLDREYCSINDSYHYTCDILRLEELENMGVSLQNLEELHAMFRGEFMEGYYFNNCDELNELILDRRITYEKGKAKILTQIADLYEEAKQFDEAAGIMEEILEMEPYNESIATRLMTLYSKVGNLSGAISFYHTYRNRLAENLAIYPGRAMNEKYLELKSASTVEEQYVSPVAQNKAGTKAPALVINTSCLRSIPYFWMSDVARKLIRTADKSFLQSLQPEMWRNLAAILPEALELSGAEQPGVTTPTAVSNSFIQLVDCAAARTGLVINIANSEEMDEISADIWKYLQYDIQDGLKFNLINNYKLDGKK